MLLWRASMSYVSGAHNMKFGYQGGFSTPTKNYYYDSQVIQVRTNNGIPNQITETITPVDVKQRVRYDSLYAQEQWKVGRMTV